MKITNKVELEAFLDAVDKCKGKVTLHSPHGDVFNLKSTLSKYVALGQLLGEHGDELELFCDYKEDEMIMLNYFDSHQEVL